MTVTSSYSWRERVLSRGAGRRHVAEARIQSADPARVLASRHVEFPELLVAPLRRGFTGARRRTTSPKSPTVPSCLPLVSLSRPQCTLSSSSSSSRPLPSPEEIRR